VERYFSLTFIFIRQSIGVHTDKAPLNTLLSRYAAIKNDSDLVVFL
jgi:hypothetical protein